MAKWAFLNDDFIEEDKALLHISDLSVMRGYGIFDFFRLVGQQPLFLEDHLNRFYASAQGLHLLSPMQREELERVIKELIKKNELPDTGIRLSLTGGYSPDGFSITKPNFIITQHSIALPTEEQLEGGINLLSYPYQRQISQFKTIDYTMAIWVQPLKIEKGADDILYHWNNIITEAPRSNFFIVTQENKIVTPSQNVLLGVTRKNLIALAQQYFTVEERDINLEELKAAKEAFITSTTKQILPVAKIDNIVYKENKIGLQLLQLFRSAFLH